MKRGAVAGVLGSLAISIVVLAAGLVAVDRAVGSGQFGTPPLTADGNLDIREVARRAAVARGDPIDARSIVEVIRAEEARGKRAFYALSPAYFAQADGPRVMIDGRRIVPIGIVPRASSYYCNESGSWTEFSADRLGLRNPDVIWNMPRADLLIVGDSFAWGSCLPEEQGIAGRIRTRFPLTINAAIGANGPLTALAAVREIARVKRPKQVIWVFFENDFEDLQREMAAAVLPNYLDRSFRQDLLALAPRIGPVIEEFARSYLAAVEKAQAAYVAPTGSWTTLPHLRRLYSFLTRPKIAPPPADLDTFRKIMIAAKADVEGSGGTLRLVYVPDCPATDYRRETWREPLLRMLGELKIEVVDTDAMIKSMQRNGPQPYFYCPASHFNPAGAAAVADAVLRVIGPP
jgi:hypothetical protein